MFTVKETAAKLSVTPERVRNMIYAGVLPAQKFGNNWAIPERAVLDRLALKPGRGRPKKSAEKERIEYYVLSLEHQAYKECRDVFDNGYDADILASAQDEVEKAFYIVMWDFFLQQKQQELVEQGVY